MTVIKSLSGPPTTLAWPSSKSSKDVEVSDRSPSIVKCPTLLPGAIVPATLVSPKIVPLPDSKVPTAVDTVAARSELAASRRLSSPRANVSNEPVDPASSVAAAAGSAAAVNT